MMCRTFIVCAWIPALVACGGGSVDADTVEPEPDSSSDRSFALGFEALDYRIGGAQRWVVDLTQIPKNTGGEPGRERVAAIPADAVVVPAYVYGIPWSEFAGKDDTLSSLPGSWVAKMQSLRTEVEEHGLRVVLALNPVNSKYDNLAPEASDDGSGEVRLRENWLKEYCPNPSDDGNPDKWARAYSRYVAWMVDLFEPEFVGLARSINLYEERCESARPGAYAAVVAMANRAHSDLKGSESDVTTFTGVLVEDLYGYPRKGGRCPSMSAKDCFAERKVLLDGIESDRLGLESYPAAAVATLKELPGDWLAHIAENIGGREVVFTGLGMPGRSIEHVSGVCVPWVDADEEMQRSLLDQAATVAKQTASDLLVWSSVRDLYTAEAVGSCACSSPKELCDHLDQLGGAADEVRPRLMQGLYTEAGDERLAGELWRALSE